MWPFNLLESLATSIDERFATAGQIRPHEVETLARRGPVLDYCRSGARSANLHNAIRRKA